MQTALESIPNLIGPSSAVDADGLPWLVSLETVVETVLTEDDAADPLRFACLALRLAGIKVLAVQSASCRRAEVASE